ncbi:MAG: leucine--tRNA ligase [Firmicutes bacterium]|nr:leucine--tRNA ligase [Bacillota bacterium]
MNYPEIHKKWQKYWQKNNVNKFDMNSSKPKYYTLEMFPYPSGANLHLGHFFNFAPCDTHARFKRMMGYNVFHPMGFDAFGLPAENHALSTGTHPHDNTIINMEKFRKQLDELGGMYPWEYTLTTCFPEYYTGTQWLFLQLFRHGLAYQKESTVNFCDKCKTVIANEQVIDGECERCSSEVIRRDMKQWFFKITDFAGELLDGIDGLDWPNKTKTMQQNWIGRSCGANVIFNVENSKDTIEVFTTRIDTIFGATFIVLAPENCLVKRVTTSEQEKAIDAYIKKTAKKSDIERMENHEKTGVFTGGYAINPASGKRVPIYIADYVLNNYGTGAVMGVPAHDERDHEFATKYKIEIKQVIKTDKEDACVTEFGTLINSDKYNDLSSEQAIIQITKDLEKIKSAKHSITYRLRDWSMSRQRYWGVPIPIVYCECCGIVPVPESQLPVKLPYINDFKPHGAPPLANDENFVNTTCPSCNGPAKRETETMDTFVCSSWYFLSYPSVGNVGMTGIPWDKKITEKMLPVDKYIGGAEHACMHLLYARFITRFLHKYGYINFAEPFKSLVHQGMILAPDGQKMSKSKGNTITPDKYIEQYGSDVLRMYMLFGFNYIDGGPWNDATLKSITRFIERVEKIISQISCETETDDEVQYVRASTIKNVKHDLDSFSFNTAVARCMEFLNAIHTSKNKSRESVIDLILLLAPMMPHIAEEFFELLREHNKTSIFDEKFPIPNQKFLERSDIEIVVQVNSKIKERLTIKKDATQDEVVALCKSFIGDTSPKKIIYVPNKLINFIL